MKMEKRAAKEDDYDSDCYSDYSEVEVAEEALSLCDLPLGGKEEEDCYPQHPLPISQPSSEVFEFFSTENTPPLLSTQDIIFCGKILPYRSSVHDQDPSFDFAANNHHHHRRRHHRKSESLNDLQRSHSTSNGGSGSKYMRSSRSLDYKTLHRDTSLRNTSSSTSPSDGKCFGKCDFGRIPVSPTPTTTTKPKWKLLMFGVMKTPREMELKDIRNRQNRLIPSSFFTVTTVNKREEEKGSWKLLRALSCKGQANTVITASLSCV